jgi:hypothetical protein
VALHWFDLVPFHAGVNRVLRARGVLAAWSYGVLHVAGERIDRLIQEFYCNTLKPYWPAERQRVESGYRSLPFAFLELTPPTFEMQADGSLRELIGYVSTGSATARYREKNGADQAAALAQSLTPLGADASSSGARIGCDHGIEASSPIKRRLPPAAGAVPGQFPLPARVRKISKERGRAARPKARVARRKGREMVLERHRQGRGSLERRLAAHLGGHGVCDEAFLVSFVVQGLERGARRSLFPAELDARLEGHGGHRDFARAILAQDAYGVIHIAVDAQALRRGEREKPEHVTARKRCNEGLFRIDRGLERHGHGHHLR